MNPRRSRVPQGMLNEIRALISTSAAAASAAATSAPAAAASAMFSKLESDRRRQSLGDDTSCDTEDEACLEQDSHQPSLHDLETRLRAQEEVGVAVVKSATEVEKRALENELEESGAPIEEREVRRCLSDPRWVRVSANLLQ